MKTSILLGLVLGLMLASGLARAEVYRCERDGKTVYTDRACHADAQPETVRAPNTVTATPGERKLARDFDRRVERDRKARDKADRVWMRQHSAAEADAARIRGAVDERRVVRGMTHDQVRMLLGTPAQTVSSVARDADIERWTYRGDGGERVVTFRNGLVSSAGADKKRKKK